jgi:hypothetical protein
MPTYPEGRRLPYDRSYTFIASGSTHEYFDMDPVPPGFYLVVESMSFMTYTNKWQHVRTGWKHIADYHPENETIESNDDQWYRHAHHTGIREGDTPYLSATPAASGDIAYASVHGYLVQVHVGSEAPEGERAELGVGWAQE